MFFFSMAMLNNQRVNAIIINHYYPLFTIIIIH